MYTCLCAKCTCILLINKCSAIHNDPLVMQSICLILYGDHQTNHHIRFTIYHGSQQISWVFHEQKQKKQKIEKKHILENFQFQHISIFWEYIDDVFSFDAFSENKIYSWRERTLLNCLYTVNMHVYVLYFNLENTCK